MLDRNSFECQHTDCPLRLSCNQVPAFVYRTPFHEDNAPIDFLFVADHAGKKENQMAAPFLGPERALIEKAMAEYAPNATYGFTYLVRGWPVEEKYENQYVLVSDSSNKYEYDRIKTKSLSKHPKKTDILERCQTFLVEDLQKYKPKTIIVMGNFVKEALLPQESKTITRLIKTKRTLDDGTEVRFMTTPRSLLQNPSAKKAWEQQLESIAKGIIQKPDTTLGDDFLLTNLQDVLDYIEILKNTENPISIDLETLNLNKRYGNKIATIQFAETNDSGVTIPLNHPDTPFDGDEIEIIKKALYDLFKNPSKIPFWIGHNLKFECNVLKALIGTSILSAPIFDTLVAAFLLDENRRERAAEFRYGIYSLKQLALDYLNYDGYDQGILANRAEGNLFDLPLDKLSSYGAMDVYITRRLYYALLEDAEEQSYREDLEKMMFHHYTPCIRLCSDLEQNGFYIDKKHIRTLVSRNNSPLLKEIARIEEEIKESREGQIANDILLRKTAGKVIPLGNKPWLFDLAKGGHPQILFFDVLGLQPTKIGASDVPSVDASWQSLNQNNPFVAKYSEWQGLRTLYNTFATKLYKRIDPRGDDLDCKTDGKIRPDFITTGPVTGRWASRNPNLQNIPRSDNEAKKAIKNIFRASPGHYLVQLDYKANEIRWVGILAQDEGLAKAINEGREMFKKYRKNPTKDLLYKAKTYGDIHRQTASMIFNKKLEDVTKGERQVSKSVQFGILYGSSIRSIAESQQKSIEEVQEWFDSFYNRFPAISMWKSHMENCAQHKGYVETPNGRRRRFPIFDLYRDEFGRFNPNDPRISQENEKHIKECLRQAVNAPIQGIASDSGMLGAALFAEHIRNNKLPWIVSNAVHDSCVYQVPFDQIADSLAVAEHCFTDGVMTYMSKHFDIRFNLPLEIDFEIGLTWGDLEEWDYSPQGLDLICEKFKGAS